MKSPLTLNLNFNILRVFSNILWNDLLILLLFRIIGNSKSVSRKRKLGRFVTQLAHTTARQIDKKGMQVITNPCSGKPLGLTTAKCSSNLWLIACDMYLFSFYRGMRLKKKKKKKSSCDLMFRYYTILR